MILLPLNVTITTKPGRDILVINGLWLQVWLRIRFALATREFTCGLVLMPEIEDCCLAMTHPRVSIRATKGSVSSLDHHGGTRTLG